MMVVVETLASGCQMFLLKCDCTVVPAITDVVHYAQPHLQFLFVCLYAYQQQLVHTLGLSVEA
jgi:hypothetical protein